MLQKGFGAFVIDVVVAISDGGMVERRGPLPEVRKADQVPERVQELLRDQQRLPQPLSVIGPDRRAKDWGLALSVEEFARVSAFLRAKHMPKVTLGASEASMTVIEQKGVYGRHAPSLEDTAHAR
ncbi:hypothetical protein [Deinococcus pimensis]|uniref:hypothetical protein n=1 Tax=Deinococcus pimensis TaxID=309888 RepID=UPI0012FBD157|nr:hypothetical protein [Deinococcus pimensis]